MAEEFLSQPTPNLGGRPGTPDEVRAKIRQLYEVEGFTYEELAVKYKKSYNTIRTITKGLTRGGKAA